MGLFDNITTDEETKTTTKDDGGFLIIDDKPLPNTIKAEDIPDSAISFLDMSALSDQIPDSEEPKEESASEGFSLFLDDVHATSVKAEETPSIAIEEPMLIIDDIKTEEGIVTEDKKEEASQTDSFIFGATDDDSSSTATSQGSSTKDGISNPYEILDKAIADLLSVMKNQISIREEMLSEVEDINSQIATLKQDAKKLTDKSKEIALEEEKVQKMIDLFKSQKV